MLNDPLERNDLVATSLEVYPSYRDGKVTTKTFEYNDIHICYGVNHSGNVWDYCFIDRNTGEMFFDQDIADEAVLSRAKNDLQSFFEK